MFDLDLAWDRPARTGASPTSHTLRVRLTPRTTTGALPLRLAIALDTSSSMAGEKLEAARAACREAVELLRPEDRFSLAGFSAAVRERLRDLPGSSASEAHAEIARLESGGCTRADLALEWMEAVLVDDEGSARVGLLITDGHPTDARGKNLLDPRSIVEAAARLGASGVSLCAIGLGDAADFNTPFLVDLSNQGRGAFLYAESPESLVGLLSARFVHSQSAAATDARLIIRPRIPGLTVAGGCRIRPDYLPFERATDDGGAASTLTAGGQVKVGPSFERDAGPGETVLSIGTLAGGAATDLLVSVEIPPSASGSSTGEREALDLRIETSAPGAGLRATASILDTTSYREAQRLDDSINADRILWEINRYGEELQRSANPRRTGELLSGIRDGAERAGRPDLADCATRQLEELKQTGKLNPSRATGLLAQARRAAPSEGTP